MIHWVNDTLFHRINNMFSPTELQEFIGEVVFFCFISRIMLVNDAVVKYFLEDLHIRTHFDAFRKFLLLEDGEFGHSLCSQLFQRVFETFI